jgi:polyisoprenoid-binding protein YceI
VPKGWERHGPWLKGEHVNTTNTPSNDLSRLAGHWKLDPDNTSVTFRTKAMWVLPIKGTAKALSGDAQLNPDAEAAKGTLVIDAASFNTENKKRDDDLHSENFLDVAEYPTIIFTANGGRQASARRVEISGMLAIHGKTRPLTLQAELAESGSSVTLTTQVQIDRRLWGVTKGSKMGAGLIQVEIHAHFDRT